MFAGPGAGKSTTSAGVFALLKLHGINCELITEFAKDLTWEERYATLENQDYVFAKQLARIWRVTGKVEIVISDSPLLLSLYYGQDTMLDEFKEYVKKIVSIHKNINFFINRVKPYSPIGRNQNKKEAVIIDNKIKEILISNQCDFIEVNGDHCGINLIAKYILDKKGIKYP